MKKISLVFFTALFLSANLWAAGSGAEIPGDAARGAKEALESLRKAYEEKNIQGFFLQIGDEAYLDDADLREALASRFRSSSHIELRIYADHTLKENDKVLLKTHWQRRHTDDDTGRIETGEGLAQFVFSLEEAPKLLDIQGDSPF